MKLTEVVNMKTLAVFVVIVLLSCNRTIDESSIEERENGLYYIKGSNDLVDGEVISRFNEGGISGRTNFSNGEMLGDVYGYGDGGDTMFRGVAVATGKYQSGFRELSFTKSVLIICYEGDYSYAMMNISDKRVFDSTQIAIELAKAIFSDYSVSDKIEHIMLTDKQRQFTIWKSAVAGKGYTIDTLINNDEKAIIFR